MSDWIDGVDVSRETQDRLAHFGVLVEKWNRKINLVAPASLPHLWQRHILDSVQLFPHLPAPLTHYADLGSGGGFPGIVLAALLAESHPATRISLVESDQRKCAFLRTAARELSLTIIVHDARIETLPPLTADCITARALSALPDLLSLVSRHLAPKGVAILPKGRNYRGEVDEAALLWSMTMTDHQSLTDSDARILTIKDLRRAA